MQIPMWPVGLKTRAAPAPRWAALTAQHAGTVLWDLPVKCCWLGSLLFILYKTVQLSICLKELSRMLPHYLILYVKITNDL